jgi:ferrous iron transport protein A
MNALSTVKVGQPQTVVSLRTQDQAVLQKLMAFGILPGSKLVLEQRFPSYIIMVGRTRTALDQETAQCIFVESRN